MAEVDSEEERKDEENLSASSGWTPRSKKMNSEGGGSETFVTEELERLKEAHQKLQKEHARMASILSAQRKESSSRKLILSESPSKTPSEPSGKENRLEWMFYLKVASSSTLSSLLLFLLAEWTDEVPPPHPSSSCTQGSQEKLEQSLDMLSSIIQRRRTGALESYQQQQLEESLRYLSSTLLAPSSLPIEVTGASPGLSSAWHGFLCALGLLSLILAVPITHWIGQKVHKRNNYRLFQPFQGGVRFVVLQALSWTFYAMTGIIVTITVAYAERAGGLLASAGVIGVLSQVFMVSSIVTFYHHKDDLGDKQGKVESKSAPDGQKRLGRGSRKTSAAAVIDWVDNSSEQTKCEESAADGTTLVETSIDSSSKQSQEKLVKEFVQMNTGLVLIGVTLALGSEQTRDPRKQPLLAVLSLLCCISAIFLTYGIAGRARNVENGWSFAQVFRGGKEFVMLQIAGWCLFGIAILAQGFFVASTIYVGTHIPGTMYVGAVAAIASQVIIVKSLRRFQPTRSHVVEGKENRGEVAKEEQSASSPWTYRKLEELSLREHAVSLLLLSFFCNLQFVSFSCYMVLFCLPYLVPVSLAEVVEQVSFGLVPQLPGDEENFIHTFKVWWLLLWAIASWTFVYATLKTWGVKGWKLSLLLSISAVSSFGGTLRFYSESPHYRMIALICSANFVYISTTFTKRPESNACREWRELRQLPFISRSFVKYFGIQLELTEGCKKVAHQLGDENCPDQRYRQVILLFHPHSIFPLSHVGLGLCEMWRQAFPNLSVNPLTASIIHFVPVMRDVLQWLGVCDVSKSTILNLIRMGRNVQVVCGGQTEMFESRSWDKEIVLVRKRRLGIFKIAIEQGLPLLPMYSFGETLTFDNIYMPRLQGWFKRMFGFPFPFVMLGQYGLPIPHRVPIKVVVGEPVFPREKSHNPSHEEVVELQTRYFDALQTLFDQYKHQCGHGDRSIKWLDH